MKLLSNFTLFALALSLFIPQLGIAGGKDKIKTVNENISEELTKASKSGSNAILVLTDDKTSAVDESLELAKQTAALGNKVVVAVVNRDAAENEALVQKYNLKRFPSSYLLILSPEGTITGGAMPGRISAEQLSFYLPTPCLNKVLSANKAKKATLIYIHDKQSKKDKEWMAVLDEAAESIDPQPELVKVDVEDENEKSFLTKLGYKGGDVPFIVVINAKGQLTGTYNILPKTEALTAAAQKVVSSGCGSSCPSSRSCSDKKKAGCGSK